MSLFIPVAPKQTKTIVPFHPWKRRIKAKYANKYKHGHNSVLNLIYTANQTKIPDKENSDNQVIQFTVIGNRVTEEFIYCMYLVKGLHRCRPRQFKAPVLRGVTGVEWPKIWNDLKLKHGGLAFCLQSQVAILKNGEFLGGDTELKEFVNTRYLYTVYLDYYKEGIRQFSNFIQSSGRPCVYMNISINRESVGSLIFMLYADIAPLTCQNFMNMCQSSRGGYSGTPIHRIVQDCWIQCGGFTLKNTTQLECENYIVPYDRRGVLGMANAGRHKDCSTQFFVLLQPASWMNNKYVAFGQLIDGENTLKKIESVPTWYESPTSEISIDKAGVLNLECQNTPVNKRTNEYLQRHIEDLVVVGNLFYEALLERVFKEIDMRLLNQVQVILSNELSQEESDENIFYTKSKMKEKEPQTVVNNEDEENNEYDVEMYDYEEILNETVSTSYSTQNEIITKPFYLPLKDVPYPGEVDSIYDLQRFLRGDYCLESDLQGRPEPPKNLFVDKISKTVLDTLFDYLTMDLESDTSLTECDEKLLRTYMTENVDSVSFAGRIVNKMANFPQRLAIFGNVAREYKPSVLSDDELRILSVSEKEIKHIRKKSVSINLPHGRLPHGLIRRRQTRFVHPEEIPQLLEEIEQDFVDEEDVPYSFSLDSITNSSSDLSPNKAGSYQDSLKANILQRISQRTREEPIRKVTIKQNQNTKSTQKMTVLTRLYDDIRMKDEDMVLPTLKDYKSFAATPSNNYLLTQSSVYMTNDEPRETLYCQNNQSTDYSLDYVLHLQHGKKISRKISSDYARTIDHIEHRPRKSIRSVEYARKRPTMTVAEYQLRNRKYREALMTTYDKATETSQSFVGHSHSHPDPNDTDRH